MWITPRKCSHSPPSRLNYWVHTCNVFTWPVSIWISNAVSRTEHVKRYEGRRSQHNKEGGVFEMFCSENVAHLETLCLSLQNLISSHTYIPSHKTLSTMLLWKPLMFSAMYNISLSQRMSGNWVGDVWRRLMPAGLIIQWLTFFVGWLLSCNSISTWHYNPADRAQFPVCCWSACQDWFLIFTLALWGL